MTATALTLAWASVENCLAQTTSTGMGTWAPRMKERGAQVPIPVDVVCAKQFSTDAQASVKAVAVIEEDDLFLDIGQQCAHRLVVLLCQARTIVWNVSL